MKLDEVRRIGWLIIEIPPQNSMGVLTVETFHGNTCMCDYEAEESVSEIAIAHFMSQLGIRVNDVNYTILNETYTQLSHYIHWCQSLYLRHELSRVEKNGLLDTHKNLLKRLSLILGRYNDIIPLTPFGPVNVSDMFPEQLIYTGASPPETRYDQFAQELLSVLREYSAANNQAIN